MRRAGLLSLLTTLVACVPDPPPPRFLGDGGADAAGQRDALIGDDGVRCQPTAETCNAADDDCDGEVDEDFDLTTDAHCGACGNDCGALPGVEAALCEGGACVVVAGGCREGRLDCDRDGNNGCEQTCGDAQGRQLESEPATCDGLDQDCDCQTDEGTEVGRTIEHCEACGVPCPTLEHTTIGCVDEACATAACADQWFNPDGVFESGCRCNVAESPEVNRLTGGDPAPGQGYGAWFGDGTLGQLVWLEVTAGNPRRLTATTRSILGEGYPRGLTREAFSVEGNDIEIEGFRALGADEFAVLWRQGGERWFHQLGVGAEPQMLMDGCGTCLTDVVGGRLVGVRWQRDGEPPTVVQQLITTENQVLVRDDLEEPTGFDTVDAFDCRAPGECVAMFRRGGTLKLATARGGVTELEASPAAPELRRIRFGEDGLVAIWRRQREGNSETVGARIDDQGRIVNGPAVLPIPADVEQGSQLLSLGAQGFAFFYQRGGQVYLLHLDTNGSAAGEIQAFPFVPTGMLGPGVYYEAQGQVAREDGEILANGWPWPRPVAGPVSLAAGGADPQGRLIYRGAAGVFLEAREGEAEDTLLFTDVADAEELFSAVAWGEGALALAATRRGLRLAFAEPGEPLRRGRQAWMLGGEEARFDDLRVALAPWADGTNLLAATGRFDQVRGLALGLVHDRMALNPSIEFMPQAGTEKSPTLAYSPEAGGVLLTALSQSDVVADLVLRRIDALGALQGEPVTVGRSGVPGKHALAQVGAETFVVFLDDPMGSPTCGRNVRFARCNPEGCALWQAGEEGAAGRPGTTGLAAEGGPCFATVQAVPNAGGGLTVVATEADSPRLWHASLDADLRLLGSFVPIPTRSSPAWLSVVAGQDGAQAFCWRGSFYTRLLGCP